MRIAVILFPGTNCENETAEALNSVGLSAEIVRWNQPITQLSSYDGYVLPGGFSYEDRIRSGVIAAQDPIMKTIKREAQKGKPVLGICNGAQILVETGMVPGLSERDMALAPNFHTNGYHCTWVYLTVTRRTAFTAGFAEGEIFPIPIAHGEGRFTTKDDTLRAHLDEYTVFRYCTKEGNVVEAFPANPNGSLNNIAGICNKEGNVMAMMPHPERASWMRQLPIRERLPFAQLEAGTQARRIFASMKQYLEEKR